MDKSRRTALMVLLIAWGVSGCNENWLRGPTGVAQRDPVSEPVDVDEPADAVPVTEADQEETPVAEPAASGLAGQIQAYVGRFPSDDLERKASPRPVAPAPPVAAPRPAIEQRPIVVEHPRPAQPAPPVPPRDGGADVVTPAPAVKEKADVETPSSLDHPVDMPAATPGASSNVRVELVDVKPAAVAETPPSAAAANQPVEPIKPVAGDNSLEATIEQLERSVEAHPERLDDLYKLALLHLATGNDVKAAEWIERADPVRVDLISAVVEVISTARAALNDPATPASPALSAADHLRMLLAQRSPVTIPKIALVTGVQSFGAYQAVSPPRFPSGQGVHVFLYTEVANFRSKPTGDGRLKTVLAEQVEIFDADGNVIWQQSHPDIHDVVVTPRHDFFVPLEVRLPTSTPDGEYTLKVTVEDKIGATTDQRRMTFTIGNP